MEQKVFSNDEFVTSKWTGGTTTQLFIHPKNSNYSDRNFELRISIANVEQEDSEFTSLPGYDRKLLILEGGISIAHEGHHSGQMKKFDVDSFQGDWKTRSAGRCTDFNVMSNEFWNTHLFGLQLDTDQSETIPFGGIEGKMFVYLHKGSLEVETEIDQYLLSDGMLMEIDFRSMHELQLRALDQSEVVLAIAQKV